MRTSSASTATRKASRSTSSSRTAGRWLDRLIARADVLVENFRPGTLDELGLGYDDARGRHPRLIYCSISGFGQTGPRRTKPGYDVVMQAEGGLMSITGDRRWTALSPRRGDRRHRRRHVRRAGHPARAARARSAPAAVSASTSPCSTPTVALLDLSGRQPFRDRTGCPPRIGNRHPTIVPYETVHRVGRRFRARGRQRRPVARFCAVAGLGYAERFRTNRQRVTQYDELRPVPRRRAGRATRAGRGSIG